MPIFVDEASSDVSEEQSTALDTYAANFLSVGRDLRAIRHPAAAYTHSGELLAMTAKVLLRCHHKDFVRPAVRPWDGKSRRGVSEAENAAIHSAPDPKFIGVAFAWPQPTAYVLVYSSSKLPGGRQSQEPRAECGAYLGGSKPLVVPRPRASLIINPEATLPLRAARKANAVVRSSVIKKGLIMDPVAAEAGGESGFQGLHSGRKAKLIDFEVDQVEDKEYRPALDTDVVFLSARHPGGLPLLGGCGHRKGSAAVSSLICNTEGVTIHGFSTSRVGCLRKRDVKYCWVAVLIASGDEINVVGSSADERASGGGSYVAAANNLFVDPPRRALLIFDLVVISCRRNNSTDVCSTSMLLCREAQGARQRLLRDFDDELFMKGHDSVLLAEDDRSS
ncbi:hypothetical protein C8R43DRAFT_952259 [Mycena crocata]|nr:hypothetical protein C8R43DRAFT_952259 [Mycena crocata]